MFETWFTQKKLQIKKFYIFILFFYLKSSFLIRYNNNTLNNKDIVLIKKLIKISF